MERSAWLRPLFRVLFGKERAPKRRRTISRQRAAAYHCQLERLEDRLVPAIQLTYAGTGGAFSLDEVSAATDNITISEVTTGSLKIDLNGATFDAGSTTAATGLTYEVAGDPANSTFAIIDISSANAIAAMAANLGDNGDTLAIGFSQGVGDVNLDGQNGADTFTLNALTAAGNLNVTAESTTIAGNITTAGDQAYNNATILNTLATLDASTGNISFGDTLNTSANDLTLTADEIDFNGGANSTSGNGNLTMQPSAANVSIGVGGGAGTLDISDSDIAALANGFNLITIGRADGNGTMNVGTASFKDSLLLQEPNAGGNININGRLDTTGAADAASIKLLGSGATTTLNADVVTAGADIVINDSIILGTPATITLDTTDGGNVATGANIKLTAPGTVNDDTANTTAFGLNAGTAGNITLDGAIGANQSIKSLTTTGANLSLNGGSVTTNGNQTYIDNVTLGANTTVASTANGTISFNQTLDGSFTLTANTGGGTNFIGPVGGGTPLQSLTTNAGGLTRVAANVTTSGNQSYGDQLALFANITLASTNNGTLSFAQIDNNFALSVNTDGNTTFNNPVGSLVPLFSLTTDAPGNTLIGANVTTRSNQTYNDAVVLTANTTLSGANITFNSTVNSDSNATPRSLTVNSSGGGATEFNASVGGTSALASLTTNADGVTALVNVGNITTTGNQTYGDAVIVVTDTVLNGSNITFQSTLDTAGGPGSNLTVNSSGNGATTFNGAVGGNNAFTSLTTNADGTTDINGGNITAGFQTFNDAVVLTANTTLIGVDVTFNSTLNSDSNATPRSLTANNFGNTTFNGPVGTSSPLLSVTTDANGITDLNGGTFTTTGNQIYNDAVFLAVDATLNGTNITFNSLVNSDNPMTPRSLAVNSSGNGATTFNNTVGGIAPLLSLTTNADGTTDLDAGTVTTTGDQTYNDAVVLTADTALFGANVTFNSTLDSDSNATPRSLLVFSNGTTSFNGAVGGASPLANLTTDTPGATHIGANITTVAATGDQTFNDAVVLTGNATLSGNDITFLSTVDSDSNATPRALTVNSINNGNTFFIGAVGNTTPLLSLTTNVDGTTTVNGGNVTTTGNQTYSDPVVLGASTTCTTTGTGGISFQNDVNSDNATPKDLTLTTTNAAATIAMGDATKVIGGTNRLGTLTIDDAGAATITSRLIGAGTNLTKNGAGTLTINGNVGNNYSGTTTVNAGTLSLDKTGGNAVGGALVVSDNLGGNNADVVVWLQSDQVIDNGAVTVNASGLLNLNGQSDQLASLSLQTGLAATTGAATITTGAGTLTLLSFVTVTNLNAATDDTGADVNGLVSLSAGTHAFTVADAANAPVDLEVTASISGLGGITKNGLGTMRLIAGTDIFSGNVDINSGTLLIDTVVDTGGPVTVNSGGTLGGTRNQTVTPVGGVVGPTLTSGQLGTVTGSATRNLVLSGGTLSVGDLNVNGGVGQFVVFGNVFNTAGSASTHIYQLNSPYASAGTDYDQLVVNGTVNLLNATLNLGGGAVAAAPSTVLRIIDNDSTDAVSGTFNGFPDRAPVTVNNFSGVISYIGGDGNDVEIQQPSADLDVNQTAPTVGSEGTPVTFTITVTNTGPDDSPSATLTDTLPAASMFDSATASQGAFSVSSNTVTFNLGALPKGSTVTLTVTVIPTEDGPFTNTAAITASGLQDTNSANNSAQATIAVAEPPIVGGALGVNGFEFTPLVNVAVAGFSHANGIEPPGNFSATIDWGDGTPASLGTVVRSGPGYLVLGSHTYTDEGNFIVTVHVADDAVAANFTSQAVLLEELLPGGIRGTPRQRWLSEVFRDLFGRPIDARNLALLTPKVGGLAARDTVVHGLLQRPALLTQFRVILTQALFHDIFGVLPTDTQLAASLRFLARGGTFVQLAARLGKTSVGQARRTFVGTLYRHYLDRTAEPDGLLHHVGLLQRGVSELNIISGIVASREFFAKTAP